MDRIEGGGGAGRTGLGCFSSNGGGGGGTVGGPALVWKVYMIVVSDSLKRQPFQGAVKFDPILRTQFWK